MFTSDRTIRWVESLADQEVSITSGRRSSIDICSTKDEVLASETVGFIRELHQHFEYLVKLFNARVRSDELCILLLRNSSGSDDFSLQRKELELQLTCQKSGSIQLKCVRKSSDNSQVTVLFSGMVEAHFVHFHQVEWTFLASPISAEQLACHYLTEFVQTARTSEAASF